jgi:hypothetical protein
MLFLSLALLLFVGVPLHACSCLEPGPPMEELGERSIIYPYAFDGSDTLGTSICSRTKRYEHAYEDMAELDGGVRHTIWRISVNTGVTSISNPGWAPGVNIGAGAEYFFTANIAAGANVMYHYIRYNRGDSFPAYLEPYEPTLDLFSLYGTLRYEVEIAPLQLHVMAGAGYARFMPEIGVMWGSGSNTSSLAAKESVVTFVGGVGLRYPISDHLGLLAELPMMINLDAITSQYIFPVQIGLSFAY